MAFRVQTNVTRPKAITLEVDGRRISAFEGETLATVLLANGVQAFRHDKDNQPRAPYCNMGVCFECLVRDLSQPEKNWLRACLTPARDGQRISTLNTGGE